MNLPEIASPSKCTDSDTRACRNVLLVSMPFAQLAMPSIGLTLLRDTLKAKGENVEIFYATFLFANLIGVQTYSKIAAGAPANHDMLGEWVFSHALFDEAADRTAEYCRSVLNGGNPYHSKTPEQLTAIAGEFLSNVLAARDAVTGFLQLCLNKVEQSTPFIVGFTSTFQQHVASLSLARLIKGQRPQTFILFGGANCEGVMGAELIRQFDFIDAVVSGEADQILPELVCRVRHRMPLTDLAGVITKSSLDAGIAPQNAPNVTKLDSLPFVDYSDYFLQKANNLFGNEIQSHLLFETSRGCWWGERSHCTFCGLNGTSMRFRSKSAARALAELKQLVVTHPGNPVSVVDNILDMAYFETFIPALAKERLPLELFYEVKANLRKEQIKMLRQSGTTCIQPGIESLSDKVLSMMRKGVKAFQNIQLLKWCKELGVKPEWNLLWGFPEEPPEEYVEVTRIIPLISHLPPPISASTIRLDRFSPNFDRAIEFGFANVRPMPAYEFIYALAPRAISNLAYYFSYDYARPQDVSSYTSDLSNAVQTWKANYEESDLFSVDKGSHLFIWDFRASAERCLLVLTGVKRRLYLECDRARTAAGLMASFASESSAKQLTTILDELVQLKIILKGGDAYLSLAVSADTYMPRAQVLEKMSRAMGKLGKPCNGDPNLTKLFLKDFIV